MKQRCRTRSGARVEQSNSRTVERSNSPAPVQKWLFRKKMHSVLSGSLSCSCASPKYVSWLLDAARNSCRNRRTGRRVAGQAWGCGAARRGVRRKARKAAAAAAAERLRASATLSRPGSSLCVMRSSASWLYERPWSTA